jgi:hypothetical protein
LPQRTSASFGTNPVPSTGTSQLTISANRNAPTGTSTLTVTGNNGSASHTTQLQLIIQ